MILAHHAGEGLLVAAVAGGASAVPLLAAVARARLREVWRGVRHRGK